MGVGQLLLGRGLGDDALEVLEEGAHRFGGDLVAHRRIRGERRDLDRFTDAAVGAVGEAPLLAQIHEEARRRGAAEDLVRHAERNVRRIVSLEGEVADADHRLDRLRSVDDDDLAALAERRLGIIHRRHVAAAPPAEGFVGGGHDLLVADGAYRDEGRVVGDEVLPVPARQIRAPHALHDLAVRVDACVGVLAVEVAIEGLTRQEARIVLLQGQAIDLPALELRELVTAERGVHRHVGEELHRLVEVVGEGAHSDVDVLLVVAHPEVRAEELHLFGEAGAGPAPGALLEHGADQVGDPRPIGGIRFAAALDHEAEVDDRELVPLDRVDLEAGLGRRAGDGREGHVAGGTRRRRLLALGGGRHRFGVVGGVDLVHRGLSAAAGAEGDGGEERDEALHRDSPSSLASVAGMTSRTVRLVASKYSRATRWTSSRLTARYRPSSVRRSSASPKYMWYSARRMARERFDCIPKTKAERTRFFAF